MPGPIAYAAVALQTRDRLRQIRDALKAKESSGRTHPMDRQVRFLAERALEMMSASQPVVTPPPMRLYGPGVRDQVSKFLVMGAVGPDIPGYAAMFAEGQGWLRDTIHKGTPDPNREQVLTGSCDLALSFWNRVQPLLTAQFADAAEREAKRRSMQAYVLGHFCHVAADVTTSPYIDNLEWKFGRATAPPRPKLSREKIAGAIDTEAARILFRRGRETRGHGWIDWWPTAAQVPDAFHTAYRQALEETYGPGAVRPGLAAYEKTRAAAPPPPLDDALLKDGYASFLKVMDIDRSWDLLDWLGATWFLFLPSFLAFPAALTLPNGKHFFQEAKPAGYDHDRALYEWLALPFAVNSVVPVYFSIVAATSYLGVEREVIAAWISAALQLAAAIAYFATLEASSDSLRWRGLLLVAVPLVIQALQFWFTVRKPTTNPRRLQLLLSIFIPFVLSVVFLLFHAALLHGGVESGSGIGDFDFLWRLGLWLLLLAGGWYLLARLLSRRDDDGTALVTERRHHLRLFDDSTLFVQPPLPSPTLRALHYPSGRRELLRIWWTKRAGVPTLLSRRDALVFDFGAGHAVTIHAPAVPTKLSELGLLLERNVRNAAGDAFLSAKPYFPAVAEENYELPVGFVFSDNGDGETTEEGHAAKAVAVALGSSEATAYTLYHAPKVHQSIRFDRTGPTLDQEEHLSGLAGVGNVTIVAGSHQVTLVVTPNATRFSRLFRPGDIIEAPVGGVKRVIVSVESDTVLTVSTPFPAAGVHPFRRAARTFVQRPPGLVEETPAGWQVQSVLGRSNELEGAGGTDFGAFVRAGDTIQVLPGGGDAPQERVVTEVLSDTPVTVVRISRPLDAPLDAPGTPARFEHVVRDSEQLYGVVNGSDDVFGDGVTLMNEAADLAALLCLGATSHLLTAQERLAGGAGEAAPNINKVYQVFRNWNLDRRRENEWKMLVFGGAVSEKRGQPASPDPALPTLPGDWALRVPAGEAVSNELGWVNVLRGWFDMARRPETDTKADVAFRPGGPTNLALSSALAYLLDMRDPAA